MQDPLNSLIFSDMTPTEREYLNNTKVEITLMELIVSDVCNYIAIDAIDIYQIVATKGDPNEVKKNLISIGKAIDTLRTIFPTPNDAANLMINMRDLLLKHLEDVPE